MVIGTEEVETIEIVVTKTVDTKETEDRNPDRGIVEEVSSKISFVLISALILLNLMNNFLTLCSFLPLIRTKSLLNSHKNLHHRKMSASAIEVPQNYLKQ